MELRHLRYFVGVARELNFSKAAEKLLVSQPALSTQIVDLEEDLGVQLFIRSTRQVRLTAAGEVFLEEAEDILRRAEAARQRATRTARGEEGELTVSFFAAPTMFFLPELVRRFRAAYPAVSLRLRELTPDRQLDAFERNEIDVGFTRPLPPGHPYLECEELFKERFLAVMAETHPLAGRGRIGLKELAGEPFVLMARPVAVTLYDQIIALCREAGFSPLVEHTPDLMATLLMMVAAEQGVSVVPEGVRNLREKQVAYVPLDPSPEPIPLLLSWDPGRDNPARDAFLRLGREGGFGIR
ncbi:Hca operon transcriptional activator [Pseudodesulfovibrio hydrargyri]|uniref:Hca operon transcriptional activator n=1 Tax=Pseudodesulfovibrio hydrargyri TaxID=2125990 RepID=A0A1J5N793_9BACT|nr:LysR family transcriptional regulator [Pseudodesulfovibrio hydrargyri]OIQ51499.1 Hca operon transcriptional activator [Pseudodesulfovibrio hydrargyri]